MLVLFKTLSLLPLWLLHAIGWLLGWLVFGLSAATASVFWPMRRRPAMVLPRCAARWGRPAA